MGELRVNDPPTNCPNDLPHNGLCDDNAERSAHRSQSLAVSRHDVAADDKNLMYIINAWPLLAPHIHSAILALLDHSLTMDNDFPWPERL